MQLWFRYESDLAILGKAFQETTWDESLGAVKAIEIRNRVGGSKQALVDVHRMLQDTEHRQQA